MLIECKLIRFGGTIATLDGVEYHFAPLQDGAHVADVGREDHRARFLSIAEAYQPYRGDCSAATTVGSEDHQPEGDSLKDDSPEESVEPDDVESMRERYRDRFGRAPHPSMKAEKLLAKLAE